MITDTLPLSGVITDSAVLSQTVCLPNETTFAPPERRIDGVAWILPFAEPNINALYQWEAPVVTGELQPKIIPANASSIAVCTPEMLARFGPPVEGAIRMPDIRGLDAQVAVDTLLALGITQPQIYVDLQSQDRIPDVFDLYQPNQVIGSIPGTGDWILPGASVILGARGP
jgi:hypothetical protein